MTGYSWWQFLTAASNATVNSFCLSLPVLIKDFLRTFLKLMCLTEGLCVFSLTFFLPPELLSRWLYLYNTSIGSSPKSILHMLNWNFLPLCTDVRWYLILLYIALFTYTIRHIFLCVCWPFYVFMGWPYMAQSARSFPIDRDCVNTNSTSGIFKSVAL